MIKNAKHRCEKCENIKEIKAQDGWSFMGCFGGEYKGKPVYEIKECPIGKENIKAN